MRPHRMVSAAVMRASAFDGTAGSADDHRCGELAIAHIPELGDLEWKLTAGFKKEIDKHQVSDGPATRGGCADGRTREAEFTDGRVDDALRAELLPQPLGVSETAAALAGALTEVNGVRVATEFLGNPITHGIEPTGQAGRGEGICDGYFWIDRVRHDMQSITRRIGLGRAAGELDDFFDLSLHARIDGVQFLVAAGLEFLNELFSEPQNRAAQFPEIEFLLRAVGASEWLALVVAHGAVGLRFDERGATSAAGSFGRLKGC